ncbi:MAG TPA: hypothetical protein PKC76_16195 [Saprospiraceae bacterium]|nr:hypothetical protein [Saprospiraceae bacterium]HMP25673.1 hypothetical protein [Saprospiraceae bacterium]
MKSRPIIIFLCFHFITIIIGAIVLPFGKCNLGYAGRLLDVYASWTGGGHGYSFFSPDVGYQNVAKVFILTENDSLLVEAFGGNKTHLDARISAFIHSAYNIKVYELNARLLAAYVFGIYPEAKVVEISLGKYIIPNLNEYATNPEPDFSAYYEGTYSRVLHPK